MAEKTGWLWGFFSIFLLLIFHPGVKADSFVPPVSGPIEYTTCPDMSEFDEAIPETWYSTVWTGRYSSPEDPNDPDKRCENTGGHPGVDIRRFYGEQHNDLGIYSIADGMVVKVVKVEKESEEESGWGTYVVIKHDNVAGYGTIFSIYAHLASLTERIEEGTESKIFVEAGEKIGIMGNSGTSAVHLHFQIDREWEKKKPFWPKYTIDKGKDKEKKKPYPSIRTKECLEIDDCLTEAQRLEAAQDVENHTINPMKLVEEGSYVSCRDQNTNKTFWGFDSAGDFECWKTHNISDYSVEGGNFQLDPAFDDPHITSPPLSVDSQDYDTIEISMASNAPDGIGAIYFTTDNYPDYSDVRKIEFSVINDGQYPTDPYQVNVGVHADWEGIITGIRIDPANNGHKGHTNEDTIGIGYIELIKSTIPPTEYKVTVQRYYPDDYYIVVNVWGDVISADVIDGPDIISTWERHAYLANRPDIGDTFVIRIYYSDNTNEDIEYIVTDINDNFAWITFPEDGETINTTTPTFTWQEAIGASSYRLNVYEVTNVEEILIWTSSTLQSGTTSCTYNSNGQATSDLEDGKTYALYLHAYDEKGNQATTWSTFMVQTDVRPWPMFQHDAKHTGQSPSTGSATGTPTSTPKWIVSLGGSPTSPVIDSDGSIYIGTGSGNLYKVDAAGSVELFYDSQTNGTVQTPALASDGTIYLTDSYSLYALSSDGQLKWEYSIHDGSPPTIASDGTIYVGSDYYLYALNPNGELIWQSPILSNGRWVRSPVLATDGTIYTIGKVGPCSGCKIVYALDAQDGSIIWQTVPGSYMTIPSLTDEGTILVGGNLTLGSSGLYALDSSDGSQKWYAPIGDISGSVPAIGQDTIYVGTNSYTLYAIDKADGSTKWYFSMGGGVYASPIIDAAGIIYIGSNSKKFYALNPDGTVKWQYQASGPITSSAAIGSDGTVYVASYDGYLYAFDE